MILRTYDVANSYGEIIKKGSTIGTLAARQSSEPYNRPAYADCKLYPSRELVWPDEDHEFGILLLRVREQFEISKDHLWRDQNGWNLAEPVKDYLDGRDGQIVHKAAALGTKARWQRIRKEIGEQAFSCRQAEIALGNTGGATVLRNMRELLGETEFSKRQSVCSRKANKSAGGIKSAQLRAASEDGFNFLTRGLKKWQKKHPDDVRHIAGLGGKQGILKMTLKTRRLAGRKRAHNRWHVERGISVPESCKFCAVSKG